MKKNKKLKIAYTIISSLFLLTFCLIPVLAATDARELAGPATIDDLTERIDIIAVYIQGIIFTIGIIMIMWAGLTYITAGGEETKLGDARKRLIWGLVGIGVALFAYTAKQFVISILG